MKHNQTQAWKIATRHNFNLRQIEGTRGALKMAFQGNGALPSCEGVSETIVEIGILLDKLKELNETCWANAKIKAELP